MPSAGEEDSVTGTLKHVKKLCDAVQWFRAVVVYRLWRRRLIPEARVRSPVATHLLTSLNLLVSSLAPDFNWNPVTGPVIGLGTRAKAPAVGKRDRGRWENDWSLTVVQFRLGFGIFPVTPKS